MKWLEAIEINLSVCKNIIDFRLDNQKKIISVLTFHNTHGDIEGK